MNHKNKLLTAKFLNNYRFKLNLVSSITTLIVPSRFTILCLASSNLCFKFKIITRSHGGKSIGHVHKIMNTISKNKNLPASSVSLMFTPKNQNTHMTQAQTVNNTSSNPSLTPLPSQKNIQQNNKSFVKNIISSYNSEINDNIATETAFPAITPNSYKELENELKRLDIIDKTNGELKNTFYKDFIFPFTETINITLNEENFLKNPALTLGLLKVTDLTTEILTGREKHIGIFYTLNINANNYYLYWALLTSAKDEGTELLSNHQPFSGKADEQRLRVIRPLMVKEQHKENLDTTMQRKAEVFLNDSSIFEKLKKTFLRVIPKINNKDIPVYTGGGVTLDMLKELLEKKEKENLIKGERLYAKYLQKKNQISEESLNDWLNRMRSNNPQHYPYLMKLIEKNKNEF